MNAPFDPSLLTAQKSAVGQPVSRKGDPGLLRGERRHPDDLNRPDQLFAVMNAVVDALAEFGIDHIDMPATPHRVWQAIQAARL